MWLADTSVWIEHFRHGKPELADRLREGVILMHPSVRGELACGNLKDRTHVLYELGCLPLATIATDSEVLHLIETRKLWGRGLGWTDVQLLASALLSRCRLWTLDNRLAKTADDFGLS